MSGIRILNLTLVGCFGMVLSAAFCDIRWTRKKVFAVSAGMAAILLVQGVIYFWVDAEMSLADGFRIDRLSVLPAPQMVGIIGRNGICGQFCHAESCGTGTDASDFTGSDMGDCTGRAFRFPLSGYPAVPVWIGAGIILRF